MSVIGRSTRTAFAITILVVVKQAFADGTDSAGSGRGSWLTPALVYDGSALVNLRGGARIGGTFGGDLHLKVMARGEGLGFPGTSGFVDVLTIHGGRPSRLVGDAQGTNNLEGPSGTQVEEAWIQNNFSGSGASLLLGIYDLNSEFYRVAAAGLFLNSSFGVGPEFAQSGVEGPSTECVGIGSPPTPLQTKQRNRGSSYDTRKTTRPATSPDATSSCALAA